MDLFLFQQINQLVFKYIWLDTLAIFFAKSFGYIVVLLLLLFLIKNLKKYWQMVTLAILSGIFARFIVVSIIRWLLERSRPFVENHVNLLVDHVNQSAFPSGHAAFFFAVSTVVYLYNKKAGILFFIAGFLISISRVFVGIHWPSDILAGALVGIFSALLILLSFRKFSSVAKSQSPQLP